MNVSAINLRNNDETINSQVYLLNNNQDIYVSPDNIYITYPNSVDEYSLEQASKREIVLSKLSAEDQGKITKIDEAPDFILNSNEKKLKVGLVIDNYLNSLSTDDKAVVQASIDDSVSKKISAQSTEIDKTSIYRFSINSKISYEAIGEVNGQIIDKYSMDENGDFFRIATVLKSGSSVEGASSSDYFSNLYILDKDLKVVGSLENLATAAPISAARFTGSRAYFSTSKADDPLYIIDLSDSAKLSVLGAVKVSANYSYLLPFDQNGDKLISFGKENGNNTNPGDTTAKGLRLSLFDFTDLQAPKELDNYMIGNEFSDSIALSDQSTFSYSYSDNKNLLIIPVSLREKGSLSFAGSFVFSFADGHLVLKGKVDHSYGGHFTDSDSFNGFNYYDNTVKRGLYSNDSEDVIYTFSNKLLKINKLADLSSVKDLILTTSSDDYIITQPATSQTPAPADGQPSAPAETLAPDSNLTASSTPVPVPPIDTPPAIVSSSTSTSTSTSTPL